MRLVVVGGGVAGLTAAWHAVQQGAAVTVVESATRLGGQVHTERVDGYVLEHGAEGFISRSEAIPALCRSLGLEDDLLSQETHRSLALGDGGLEELPDGAAGRHLGIQASNADWGHGLRTVRGGMGRLIDALEAALGSSVITTGMAVDRLAPRTPSGIMVSMADGATLEADAVILAIPGEAIAGVLEPAMPRVASRFRALSTLSSLSVTFVMRCDDVRHPLDASGFIRADCRGPGLRACTFTSSKFVDRAPEGWCVLRTFYRPEPGSLAQTDEYWSKRCLADLTPVLGITGEPHLSRVSRWPAGIPRYAADHDKQVDEIRREVLSLGRLEVAGAAVARSGLDGAVRSGADSVRRLLVRTLA